jgi:hypothetical protein
MFLSSIETINGKIISQETLLIMINITQQKTMTITGWAVDKQSNGLASAVSITIDERIDIPTLYGLDRSIFRFTIIDGGKINVSTYYGLTQLKASDSYENHDYRFSG